MAWTLVREYIPWFGVGTTEKRKERPRSELGKEGKRLVSSSEGGKDAQAPMDFGSTMARRKAADI